MSHAAPKDRPANRLAHETSPYLLQHAHNPVDWYPWGPEAFAKARAEDKPIFLSVGYSACHWCHVMERECFERDEVAALLNERYVCVKVDREERPDVDDIYMRYVHLTQGRGGWPMSVVMRPDGVPFFGGTYFPRDAFLQLMGRLHEAWTKQRAQVDEVSAKVAALLREEAQSDFSRTQRPLGAETARRGVALLHEHFDAREGGLQARMKFPPHPLLELLIDLEARKAGVPHAREMAVLTLDKMQLGGIHDHIGGGFHRYATDPHWFLPHFEKMLYDNAQLAANYSRAAAVFGDEDYARTARGIFEWLLRELHSPEGLFYSAYDADSEGEEGKFYLWDQRELETLLGADAARFSALYQTRPGGNCQEEATGQPTGLNIPHLLEPLAAAAKRLGVPEAQLRAQVDAWKRTLLEARVKRVWPGLDDKVLTSWNALAIGAFARGGRFLKEERYTQAAVCAAEGLLAKLKTPEGRWLATYNRGQAKLPAYLDDHAYLARACLDLHETTGEGRWLNEARSLVELLDKHFWDDQGGGYFFVADDHEELLVRMKNPSDNATPSGNGYAAQVLVRMSVVTGEAHYLARAGKVLAAFAGLIDERPFAAESLLLALEQYLAAGGTFEAAQKPALRRTAQAGPVLAALFTGFDKWPVGKRLPIAVKLQVDQGWHIQAAQPNPANLSPTKLRLEAPAGAKLVEVSYPEAQQLKVDAKLGWGDTLQVYSGEVLLRATLEWIAPPTEGPLELILEVDVQACNERACERPATLRLGLASEIIANPAGASAQFPTIFGK